MRGSRWAGVALGAGAAGVAAAVTMAALAGTGAPACAATGAITGRATFYQLRPGAGNCSYPRPPADGLYTALPPGEYAGAARCGAYLDVRGPRGTVRVQVIDQCAECEAGHLDLSRTAFARIADPGKGTVGITYRPVADPLLTAPLSFRIKEGSSAYWLAVLPLGHGNPISRLQVSAPGRGVRPMVRTGYNYWLVQQGMGPGPFTLRLTDSRGHVAVVRGLRLAAGVVQPTSVRMYGAAKRTHQRKKAARTPRPTPASSVPPAATPVPAGPPATGPAPSPAARC
jgi:expansin (peptidoglycan-binding protein)